MAQIALVWNRCPIHRAGLGVADKCYPIDQLMHQVMDRFVRQPLVIAAVLRRPRLERQAELSEALEVYDVLDV